MSRSYKRTPVLKICGKTKYAKRLANKKLRLGAKNNPYKAYSGKGNDYRKEMDSRQS